MSKQRKYRSRLGLVASAGLLLWTLAPLGSTAFAASTPTTNVLGGADRMATAIQIAQAEFNNAAPPSGTVIIASGDNANLIDSVTVAPLAKALGAPILLSQSATQLGSETLNYLTSNNITKVYLVGAAANSTLQGQLPAGVTVTQLTGADRYATAAAVAQKLAQVEGKTSFSTVYVATGDDAHLADALAIAPWAASQGDPVLLAAPGQTTLPASEQSLVTGQSSQTEVVVGTAAGYNLAAGGDTQQTIGSGSSNDYANAVAIAQHFAPSSGYTTIDIANDSSTDVVNANGIISYHLVDAITGGPLAAMQGAPILFTNGASLDPSVTSFLASSVANKATTVNVFGGPASIPASTVSQIANTIASGQTSAYQGQGSLSKISVSGQAFGDGSVTNPAVALNGSSITVSSTLLDANGNPVPGVNVQLYFTNGSQPVSSVTSNGQALSEAQGAVGPYFNVPTNSQGVASAQLSEAGGTSTSVVVQYWGPYIQNGVQITSNKAYLEFVGTNGLAISPEYSGTGAPQGFSIGNAVPVVVTLPPLNGQEPVNVPVTFNLASANASGSNSGQAYFSTSNGASVGSGSGTGTAQFKLAGTGSTVTESFTQSEVVYTDSHGQATAYVTDQESGDTVYVSVSASDAAGTFSGNTMFTFGQAAIPQTVHNFGVSGVQGGNQGGTYESGGCQLGSSTQCGYIAQVGTDVTFYAQAVDANGNPVPNAQLIVVAGGNDNGTDSYVQNGTTTPFPYVVSAGQVLTGSPSASSSYGEMITAGPAGYFSFTVTNSTATGTKNASTGIVAQPNNYLVYPVENGTIETTAPIINGVTNNGQNVGLSITWVVSGNLTSIGVQGIPNIKYNDTSVSGIQGQSIPQSATTGSGYSATNLMNTYPSGIATLYVEGFSGGVPFPTSTSTRNGGAMSFNVNISGNATLFSVNGVPVSPNSYQVSKSAQIGITYSGGSSYSVTVNGYTTNTGSTTACTPGSSGCYTTTQFIANATANPPNPMVALGFTDTTAESVTVTLSSSTVSSTANLTFTSNVGTSGQLGQTSPVSTTLNAGQYGTVTLTVEDANGNPVPNTTVNFTYVSPTSSGLQDLWITAVNGVTLQLQEPSGNGSQNEPTPIPLFDTSTLPTYQLQTSSGPVNAQIGYSNVVIPGVVSYKAIPGAPPSITLYTNQQGQVSLTISDGYDGYYVGTPTTPQYASAQPGSDLDSIGTNSHTAYFTFDPNGSPNGGNRPTIVLESNLSQVANLPIDGSITWQF